ncbi:MAG: sulfatase [Phycisphaeraceae bacterium]
MNMIALLLAAVVGVCPSARADRPMSVILVVADDLNVDLACYGNPTVQTPNLDRLRKASVVFDRAYCQYPLCNPSRNSFLTGRYPERIGCVKNTVHLRDHAPDATTLPQYFKQHGYTSVSCGKVFHLEDPRSWSQLCDLRTGGILAADKRPRDYQLPFDDEYRTVGEGRLIVDESVPWFRWRAVTENEDLLIDHRIATAAINRLDELATRQTPFFLAIGFSRPHDPYFAPKRFFDLYPLDRLELPTPPPDATAAPDHAFNRRFMQAFDRMDRRDKLEAMRAWYAGISFMDEQLGRVLAHARQIGALDHTVVVFMSDHGYLVGEKGYWNKGVLYDRSCRAPLLIATPGMDHAGQTAKGIVELIDLFPTLVELCGLPGFNELDGRSLVPMLNDPTKPRPDATAYTVCNQQRSLRTQRYRIIDWGGRAGYALFDHQSDPDEHYDLASSPAHQQALGRLIQQLEALGVQE